MTRTIGTQIRGIRAPIVKEGDDLVDIVISSLMKSSKAEGYELKDRDVIGITESLVARAQGNYVTVNDIAYDIEEKFGEEIGVVFPILSRNRFSIILKAVLQSSPKVYLILSYPHDEVGNPIMNEVEMHKLGINPHSDVLSEADYRNYFGNEVKHPFTGIDYLQLYTDLAINDNISVHFSNNPKTVLQFTDNVLVADIHTRHRTKNVLKEAGAKKIYGLDDICTAPINGSGYNPEYGLLGSNMATEDKVKLFPRDGDMFVNEIQTKLKKLTGKNIEVMIYGDGAFKDPSAKIWELADPVVSPAFTRGLCGTPSELKLKYLADNKLSNLNGEEACGAIKKCIKEKSENLINHLEAQGTTPRQLTDLLGSLCDLTSGSGDKGTPIILIQSYFDNFAVE